MTSPKQTLIYDLKSMPSHDIGFDAEKMLYAYKEHGIVFYDSHEGGDKPEVVNIADMEVTFVDVSKEEGMKNGR